MFQNQIWIARTAIVGAMTAAACLPLSVARAATETVVYSFKDNGKDGKAPDAGLTSLGTTLYGKTQEGGKGYGTVFKINLTTGAESVIYKFCSTGGTSCTDGAYGQSGLTNVSGTLYGTTSLGGAINLGVVFKLDTATHAETVVHSFQGGGDALNPNNTMLNAGGTLYGVTAGGGANFGGAVYKVDPASGAESVLYSFCSFGGAACTDGNTPGGSLTGVSGILYGTTLYGGTTGCATASACAGTVFKLDPTTKTETVLYSFKAGSDGQAPLGGLVNVSGKLYGTTYQGGGTGCGGSGCGTVFEVNPKTGAETVVHAFQASGGDGTFPAGGLVNVGGTLYGTTGRGGQGNGTVFAFNPTTGVESVVYAFQGNGTDGTGPLGGLISAGGALYGTTYSGGGTGCGGPGCGTVFKVTP